MRSSVSRKPAGAIDEPYWAAFLKTATERVFLSIQVSEVSLAKVFTIPVLPDPSRRKGKKRSLGSDYIKGQRQLVEAMKYLVQQDPEGNRDAINLLSEHFRTRFRMSDRPSDLAPQSQD